MTAPAPRIYLTDSELAALMGEARGPLNSRMVQCAFGSEGVWLDPRSVDEHGNYPRWVLLRLAVLRGKDLAAMDLTDTERVELAGFAAVHGREVTW